MFLEVDIEQSVAEYNVKLSLFPICMHDDDKFPV